MAQDSLKSYREKRDFNVTSEPRRSGLPDKKTPGEEVFVIQKHDARRLHYDFRLEVGGVLKSWAIPKGPSTDPKERRLAVETEDHPLGYAGFEGVIPKGQYGAGTVIIWDTGPYRNMTETDGKIVPMEEALRNGHAAVWLYGRKLKGGYALTRTKKGWILVKMRDDKADSSRDILEAEPRSVLSGLTIEELIEEE